MSEKTTVVRYLLLLIYNILVFNVQSEICITPNSTEGECMVIYQCEPLNEIYNKALTSGENVRFLRKYQCGFTDNTPKVCCPTGEVQRPFKLPQRPTKVEPVTPLFENRFGENDKMSCGIQYSDNRIFDGTITDLLEFPWMALLAYETEKGIGLACGGVLLNENYVLTAAHCLVGKAVKKIGKLVAVRLGEYNTATTEDCDEDYIDETCAPPPVDFFVASTHPHPDYVPDTPNRYHDIGVIKLQGKVTFTDYVQPICLPNAEQAIAFSKPGLQLQICGWGQTEKQETGSAIKLKALVPLVSEGKCKPAYEVSGIQIGATQICAGGGTQDSCKGDSGGPLMYEDKSDSVEFRWYAVGVISFGAEPCAKPGVPAVYTKIGPYLDWIHTTMKQ